MINYKILQEHYESCVIKHGSNAKGMDWPSPEDLSKRFQVLTEIMEFSSESNKQVDVLDLGCGVGLLIDYMAEVGTISKIKYYGLDRSPIMIDLATKRHPEFTFGVCDILIDKLPDNSTDYIIMNGLFTEKRELTFDQMFSFFISMISEAFRVARKGISFNVMSSHVDWQRNDLFHVELDRLVSHLIKQCSRNIVIRMDYGLYEYTVYVKK